MKLLFFLLVLFVIAAVDDDGKKEHSPLEFAARVLGFAGGVKNAVTPQDVRCSEYLN
jgi:uncharacterized membrane protein